MKIKILLIVLLMFFLCGSSSNQNNFFKPTNLNSDKENDENINQNIFVTRNLITGEEYTWEAKESGLTELPAIEPKIRFEEEKEPKRPPNNYPLW